MENKVILGDCMDFLKDYPDKYFELSICDPPYGIFSKKENASMNWKKQSDGGTWGSKYKGQAKKWDIAPEDNYFTELKRVSKEQIIWGANYFGYPFDNFIIWRKLTISENFSMSMAEIASVSLKGNGKIYSKQPQDINRFHPTQKPIALYKWILDKYAKQGDKILDTHVGSGSSRIACFDYGFDFTGFEIDKDYWEAQEKRFKNHISQLKLF